MIRNKEELKYYLETDKKVYGIIRKYPRLWGDEVWKFQIALRKEEYYYSQRGIFNKFMMKLWRRIHKYYGLKLGFDIPVCTFGPGLRINHFGLVVVNERARIGAYCDLHQGVNIGMDGLDLDNVPILGDNVWIGPGAKLFGKISIANNIAIGANAVVNKSFLEENITIAGVPAHKISDNGNIYIK